MSRATARSAAARPARARLVRARLVRARLVRARLASARSAVPAIRRFGAAPALAAILLTLVVAFAAGCARSPNRGTWRGDFAGSLSGEVELRVDARGDELTGSIEGQTAEGAPFTAEMEGRIEDEHFYATFEGTGRADVYRVPFTGFMRGRLGAGTAEGDWEAEVRARPGKLAGTWTVEQVALE